LLLLIDEFASLKRLTVIEEALAFMAGYGLKAYLIRARLVFVAGQAPIYGRQILYFRDPTFQQRARIEAPQTSDHI